MQRVQKELMRIHHGYFMALGLGMFLAGFTLQFMFNQRILSFSSFQLLTVIGALLLGYGTGRCDQKCAA